MDSELIIYLIFLAIIIISRLLKKPASPPSSPRTQGQDTAPRPAKSFEELLEEFTTGRRAEEEEEGSFSGERYDEYEQEEEQVRETETAPDYSPFERYPEKELKTLDEMVDIEKVRTRTRLESKKEEDEKIPAKEVHDLIRNPDDARKAIILSEIIRRRY